MVPVLNEAKYIVSCLETILLQDYPRDRIEVLVVDGGSSDGTREAAEAFAAQHAGWRVLNNPGRTQAKAFNLGLQHSRGEFYVRMDAHALYPADYVRQCVETLQRTGAANTGGALNILPGGPGMIAASIAAINRIRFGTGWARHRVGGAEGPTDSIAFGAFPRKVFDVVGPMDERFPIAEDKELNCRLRMAGMTCYFRPDIVITYFTRASLGAFLWQMFIHGQSLIPSLTTNIRTCSLRHALPLLFVSVILLLLLSGYWWPSAFYIAATLLATHLLTSVAVAAAFARRDGWRHMFVLPWLFPLTHFSYGLGSLYGIFVNELRRPSAVGDGP